MRYKLAFFEIEDWEKKYIKSKLKKHELKFFNERLNKKNIKEIKDFDIVSVFIYSYINKNLLTKLSKLKLITTRSTGFEHINIEECKERRIKVCNVPIYGANTVAEHTFALILCLSRKIHESWERTTRGNFSLEGLRGFDLKDKTIGIIGAGSIGKNVIRIARGFDMKVLAYDLHKDKKLAKKLEFKYTNLDDLLKKSDIISLHVPYNKNTHHLINKKNLKLIKKGALLINTARGSVIDTDAIVKSLDKGILGGAGLDVLEEEGLIKEEKQLLSKNFPKGNLKALLRNHILLTQKNVIITPHNAFNSKEALQRILDTTILNIKSFINKKPKNLVKSK
jgi:D-lactate dehydrogenase